MQDMSIVKCLTSSNVKEAVNISCTSIIENNIYFIHTCQQIGGALYHQISFTFTGFYEYIHILQQICFKNLKRFFLHHNRIYPLHGFKQHTWKKPYLQLFPIHLVGSVTKHPEIPSSFMPVAPGLPKTLRNSKFEIPTEFNEKISPSINLVYVT